MSRAAHRVAAHFGEWLQGRLGPGGPVVLVTLACDALAATATHRPAADLSLVQPDPPVLSVPRLGRFLAALGMPRTGAFRLRLDMPAGGGAGASTAALVALARAAGHHGPGLAAACRETEGATDPLMLAHPDRWLWAPRHAEAIAPLPPPPRMTVIGGFLGPPQRTEPGDEDFPDIADLAARWAESGGAAHRAGLASLSAARTTALRGPADDPLPELARDLGALGHARAHTGPARALLFPPGAAPAGAVAALRAAGLTGVLHFETGLGSGGA